MFPTYLLESWPENCQPTGSCSAAKLKNSLKTSKLLEPSTLSELNTIKLVFYQKSFNMKTTALHGIDFNLEKVHLTPLLRLKQTNGITLWNVFAMLYNSNQESLTDNRKRQIIMYINKFFEHFLGTTPFRGQTSLFKYSWFISFLLVAVQMVVTIWLALDVDQMHVKTFLFLFRCMSWANHFYCNEKFYLDHASAVCW